MASRRRHIALAFVWLVGTTGCLPDAEHTNPLDPLSEDFENTGAIEGRTTRFYPPFSPLANAEVRLTPGPFITTSDADGRFVITNVPVGTYGVQALRDGFSSFMDTVSVSLGQTTSDVSLRLDGLPVVRSFVLRTIHVSRWWPQEDLYTLEIAANLEDPDGVGDVAEVWFEIASFDFARELAQTGVVGRYQLTMQADSLPVPTLHSLQGTEFLLYVEDAAGFVTQSSPRSIVRVIDETPIAEEPQGLTSVEDGRPLLVWEDAALPYASTYRIDVVLDQANVQNVVLTVTDIESEVTRYQVETPLASGTYFWTVSVVDEFGNRSRSKEAGFVVPP